MCVFPHYRYCAFNNSFFSSPILTERRSFEDASNRYDSMAKLNEATDDMYDNSIIFVCVFCGAKKIKSSFHAIDRDITHCETRGESVDNTHRHV